MSTYSNRDLELVTVKKVHEDGRTVTWANGWSFGIPDEHVRHLVVGAQFLSETQRMTSVTGMATVYFDRAGEPVVDQWLWHKDDEQLEREHAEMVAGFERERQERLAKHRDDWTRREALLPEALRSRLERFRVASAGKFDADGWGYELIVCELAVLYAASGQVDDDAVNEFARTNGTSGNQHDYAKSLSKYLTDNADDQKVVANSVSSLSPLTGSADYSEVTR